MLFEDFMQIISKSSVAGTIKRSFDRRGRNWIKHFVIPDFQRPYCWNLNDIRKILDDIDELRYSPDKELYRDDEYYLGSICIMSAHESQDPEHQHDIAVLDGQQRLTSLMILAHVLYDRAMKSTRPEIRELGTSIDWCMGGNQIWKQAFLYREPLTQRRILKIHSEIEREYRQIETDAALDNASIGQSLSFYEKTLLGDLRRFCYILIWGRFAVTVLQSTAEAEQYFQGENNRGLPMTLLDILKAYHTRFTNEPKQFEEIRKIWNAFNVPPACKSESKTQQEDEVCRNHTEVLAERKQAVEAHVLPAMLMRFGIEPWSWTANIPKNADLLKGIIGTHRGDRIVDQKISSSGDSHLFDLLEPIQTGIGFFRALDQYRRIDEALSRMEQEFFNPALGLSLNSDQTLILRLALIAWIDRFGPKNVFQNGTESKRFAEALTADHEFRVYARHFARFINRLRNKGADKDSGAFDRLDKTSLLRCLRYWNTGTNLIFLPHRSATPAACRREFMAATTPDAMNQYLIHKYPQERYLSAYLAETTVGESAAVSAEPVEPQ